jgi:hypothetical protein
MNDLDLSHDYYIEWFANSAFSSGRIYHIKKNDQGGSISKGVARFFVTSARIPPEGYHPHQRLDCFVSDAMLVPQPEELAKLLFQALKTTMSSGSLHGWAGTSLRKKAGWLSVMFTTGSDGRYRPKAAISAG